MAESKTVEEKAMWAATLAARQVIAQSKNPATTLGQYPATTVAFHAAWAAIHAHRDVYDAALLRSYQDARGGDVSDDELLSRLWGSDPQ